MVVPNRAGIWVHTETTPFGHGAPFGKNQLRRMLADALFEVDHRQTLLAVPPQRPFGWMDRPLMKIAPRTGGLHVLRAVNRAGPAPLLVGRAARRRTLFAPQPARAAPASAPPHAARCGWAWTSPPSRLTSPLRSLSAERVCIREYPATRPP